MFVDGEWPNYFKMTKLLTLFVYLLATNFLLFQNWT